VIKDGLGCPGYYAHGYLVKDVRAIHGVGLATACLTIGENCPVITAHDIRDGILSDDSICLLLSNGWLQDLIESESEVVAVAVEVLLHLHCFGIVKVHNHFILLLFGSEGKLLLDSIKWSKSSNYPNCLSQAPTFTVKIKNLWVQRGRLAAIVFTVLRHQRWFFGARRYQPFLKCVVGRV